MNQPLTHHARHASRSLRASWRHLLPALLVAVSVSACSSTPNDLGRVRANVAADHPGLRQIAPADVEAAMRRDRPPLLLDVRTPAEFAVSHLRGARLVEPGAPAEALRSRELAGVSLDAPIVCYCAVGVRSSNTCEALQKAGYTNVANLDGSIFRWANEGRPLVQGETPTTFVHPYNAEWGRMLAPAHRADVPPIEE
ncbi:MAG: rhodanese-like domain-containing protein [Kofleriaceae bacterium]